MYVDEGQILWVLQWQMLHVALLVCAIVFAVVGLMAGFRLSLSSKTKTNKGLFVFSLLVVLCYVLNPFVWYQFVAMTSDSAFELNGINLIIALSNILASCLITFSFYSKNGYFKLVAVVALPTILWQIFSPSTVIFSNNPHNPILNMASLMGYFVYLSTFLGLILYQLIAFLKKEFVYKDMRAVAIGVVLLLLIGFPYIVFSRYSVFVDRLPSGQIDLRGFLSNLQIAQYSIAHLLYATFNILIFVGIGLLIILATKLESRHEILVLLSIGLLSTYFSRRATIFFDSTVSFYMLPDSPCAIGSFVAFIALLFKKNILACYSVFITLPYTLLNNLLLFQGDTSNFFNYLVMDSAFYHVWLAIICLVILSLNFEYKRSAVKWCIGIFGLFFLVAVLLGNIITRVNYLYGINMGLFYIGFFYRHSAFPFLENLINVFVYRQHGFDILPINWLIIMLATAVGSYLTYYFIKLIQRALNKIVDKFCNTDKREQRIRLTFEHS